MAVETSTVDAPQIRIGVRFGMAVVLFLAAIAVFIAIAFDPPTRVGEAETAQTSVVDYALRHAPATAQPVDYGLHDYALRHGAIASETATVNSPDYALRHAPGTPVSRFANSPDYALRHLEG